MMAKIAVKPSKIILLIKVALVCDIAAWLSLGALWGYILYRDIERMRPLLSEAKALKASGLRAESLPKACRLAGEAAGGLRQFQDDAAPLLWISYAAADVPLIGRYAGQLDPAVDYAASLSEAGQVLCRKGLPLWQTVSAQGADMVQRPDFAAQVDNLLPDLDAAEGLLNEALEDAGKIDADLLPAQYRDDFETVNAGIPLALRGLAVARELPAALQLAAQVDALQARGLQAGTLAQASGLTAQASETLHRLRTEIQDASPLLKDMEQAGAAGQYFSQAGPAVDYLDHLAQGGLVLMQAALPLVDQEDSHADAAGDPPKWYSQLIDQQPAIAQAQDLLKQAAADRARIDAGRLPGTFRVKLAAADRLLAQAQSGLALLQMLPGLMGDGAPRTYLILVQNRDELRATGGFITAFGLLRLEDGHIVSLEIESSDSNAISEVRQAPEPLRSILQAYYWLPRDANWSPDFPTSAREVEDLYRLWAQEDSPIDGAVAFDQDMLEALLAFLGPLEMPDGTAVNAENVQAAMVQYKEAAILAGQGERRKDFMSILAPRLIDQLLQPRPAQGKLDLVRLVYRQIQQGHLQIFSKDPAAEQALHDLGMDGAVRPEQGDFLMLVDSNLGISKMDALVQRSIVYQVDLSDPRKPAAVVRLSYQHTQPGTEPCHQGLSNGQDPSARIYYFSRCYWNYWRLLTAGGTRLNSAQFDPVPAEYFDDPQGWKNTVEASAGEHGTQVFAGLVVVPQNQAKEVTLASQLPNTVVAQPDNTTWLYRLRVQKQAGIARINVRIQVAAPKGFMLASPPAGWTYDSAQNLAAWQGEIVESTDFALEFKQAALP